MKSRLNTTEPRHLQNGWIGPGMKSTGGLRLQPNLLLTSDDEKDGFTPASPDPEVRAFGLNTANVHVAPEYPLSLFGRT